MEHHEIVSFLLQIFVGFSVHFLSIFVVIFGMKKDRSEACFFGSVGLVTSVIILGKAAKYAAGLGG